MARAAAAPFGGRLESLCEWLDLPRLVVLDVSLLGECRLPTPPSRIDGLLLDNVASTSDVYRWQTWLEASWGVPVLGALQARPALRAEASGPRVREACRELGNLLARHVLLERLIQLAGRRPLPDVEPALFRPSRCCEPLTVALAYDAAFNCYFADTVDLLEARGARIVDFSPLADEALPLGTDLVYMGCGHPERFADELARNNCMLVALRNHVRAGRRIYAEGGGAAYLCQHLDNSRGGLVPMVGALPAMGSASRGPA
jgi:cobyrinic acid a,c-diamide synthase